MKPHILLVEDEKNLGATLSDYLQSQDYEVTWCENMAMTLQSLQRKSYQIALLDIGLPDGDGFELAKTIKKRSPYTAFMFLSAQNDPDIKVAALELGAQDYMTKPFSIKELSFRLNKIIEFASQAKNSSELTFGPLKIWFNRYQVQDAHGQLINLGAKECEILKNLIEKSPNVLSRDEIITNVWGIDATPSYRTVDNYIVTLRKWAETDPEHHFSIQSVRGIGYKLITKE